MAKVESKSPEEKPLAVTYYGHRRGGAWEVWKVLVYGATVKREKVLEHPERRVARERLRVLLDSPEVLP